MNQKKIIRKIVVPTAIIFVVSIGILLCQFPFRITQSKKRIEKLNQHTAALTQKYQSYLTTIAQKIKTIPVDQSIISEIQSKFAQESSGMKLYLWMSDRNGEFVFGVPAIALNRLNSAFDKYHDVIENDGNFQDRNDFLMKLIDKYDEIDLSEFASNVIPSDREYEWRFYKETVDSWNYATLPSAKLSSIVVNAGGEILGDLYLKIDDSANKEIYYSKYLAEENDIFALLIPIFATLAFFSGLLLWFLPPTWVYIDAQQRGVKNPILWAFLVLISFIFGLTVYLITRPANLKSIHCPQCEKELNGTKAFCPYCGFDVSSTLCPQCQYSVKADWLFCPNCRADLKREQPVSLADETSDE